MVDLRRENTQLQAAIRRSRLIVQDMANQRKTGGKLNKHSINMLDHMGHKQSIGSMKQGGSKAGLSRLGRSESGSSIMTSMVQQLN